MLSVMRAVSHCPAFDVRVMRMMVCRSTHCSDPSSCPRTPASFSTTRWTTFRNQALQMVTEFLRQWRITLVRAYATHSHLLTPTHTHSHTQTHNLYFDASNTLVWHSCRKATAFIHVADNDFGCRQHAENGCGCFRRSSYHH
jgi:hypothetical protein